MNVNASFSHVLLFNVNYKDQEAVLQLSKYHTVGDLKAEISDKLKIPVSEQSVNCWYKNPENDDDILENCCERSLNFLVVYNSTETEESAMDCDQTEADPDTNKVMENSAAVDFIQHFSENYNDSGIMFHMCCLEDAINEACFTSLKNRRNLLLYFHNGIDQFSKIFGENLSNQDLKDVLNKRFFILGWNLENETYHFALKEALLKRNELSYLEHFIENKICAALIIVPIKESITLFSCLKGKVSKRDFVATLKKAADFLITENQIEEDLSKVEHSQNDLGSAKYQQLMFDMLADRDYDSFDFEEFHLLKEKIGFALFGPPQKEEGYTEKDKKKIEALFKVILEQNNAFAKWKDRVILSFIYNCIEPLPSEKNKRLKKYPDYNPETDLTPVPVFVLRKCKNSDDPCRIFIDDSGRVYSTWSSYLKNNKLGECEMILPANGRYETDENGNAKLEKHLSPACGIGGKILQGTDLLSTGVGLASGGIFIAAAIPTITVAPVALIVAGAAGIGVGIYSIGRSAYTLYDRTKHKESLSFANSESRGAYLNIVAGSLGFVGAGANMAVSQLAARGFNIGQGASTAVNVLGLANIGASGISVVNSGYDVFDQWFNENQKPSLLTIVQLSSSILFFGHAVYNFKSAGTIIEEAQTNALRDYQDSLRSNRHRRTFNKLLKETIRQNNNDVVKGQAEVIKTVTNIANKDEVFAALTRSNKAMNENGVKFSAEAGEIRLNGVAIDVSKFTTMDKSEVVMFLSDFQNTPEPSTKDVTIMSKTLEKSFSNATNVFRDVDFQQLAFNLVKIFGNVDEPVKQKIINAVAWIVTKLLNDSPALYKQLDTIFPNHDKFFRLFNMVNGYFQCLIDEAEEKYQRWLNNNKSADFEEPYFATLSLEIGKRAIQIFSVVSKVYFVGVNPTEMGIRELLKYFYTWFTKQVVAFEEYQERKQKRVIHSGSPARKNKCEVCGGEFYRF